MIEQAPHYHEGFRHERPHDVHTTREMEVQAYALYGVEPISPRPAEAYVCRFRAVVVSR
jgi:hypothetical protein